MIRKQSIGFAKGHRQSDGLSAFLRELSSVIRKQSIGFAKGHRQSDRLSAFLRELSSVIRKQSIGFAKGHRQSDRLSAFLRELSTAICNKSKGFRNLLFCAPSTLLCLPAKGNVDTRLKVHFMQHVSRKTANRTS